MDSDSYYRDASLTYSLFLLGRALFRLAFALVMLPVLFLTAGLRLVPYIKRPANWTYMAIVSVLVPDK